LPPTFTKTPSPTITNTATPQPTSTDTQAPTDTPPSSPGPSPQPFFSGALVPPRELHTLQQYSLLLEILF
jgi:hypothetical protein